MDEKIAKEWVAALRHPDAQQTTGKLGYCNGRRCCLGVVSDLAVKAEIILTPEISNSDYLIYDGMGDSLPRSVMTWMGLTAGAHVFLPFEDYQGDKITLVMLNDDGFTFSQIADIIECFWREL